MAKDKSILRLQGDLGGMTFYQKDGKTFVRTTTSLDGNRIRTAPEFKRTRENMAEFGGAAAVSKAMRTGLASIIRTFGDRYVASRLTGLFKRLNSRGPGNRGERTFEIVANKDLLAGLDLNRKDPFDGACFAPFTATVNTDRDEVVISFPDFHTGNLVYAPQGATHFRLLNVITVLSDFAYQPATGTFEPTDPALNALNAMAVSAEIPLGGMVGGVTTLAATLASAPTMTATAGLVSLVGIEFLQEVNGSYYLFAEGNAMKVVDVF